MPRRPPPPSIPRFASSPYLNRPPSSLLFPFIEDCPEDNGCGGVKSNRLRRRGTERRTSSSMYLLALAACTGPLTLMPIPSYNSRPLPSQLNFDQRTECWLVVRPYLPTPSHCRHAQRPSNRPTVLQTFIPFLQSCLLSPPIQVREFS